MSTVAVGDARLARMKLLSIAALLLLVPSFALAERDYSDANAKVTHDCAKEPSVVINASASTYTFTGKCAKIVVNGASAKLVVESVEKIAINGASNKVDIGAADKISLTGSSNVVTWKTGLSGAKPKVSSVGTGNKISQTK